MLKNFLTSPTPAASSSSLVNMYSARRELKRLVVVGQAFQPDERRRTFGAQVRLEILTYV
jgi:hypothetical protein